MYRLYHFIIVAVMLFTQQVFPLSCLEFAKSHGLHGYVGTWIPWVKILRGLRRLRGSKYFLRGSTFYVRHNIYLGSVGQTYFCVGQIF